MANKQTRSLHPKRLSVKVAKGERTNDGNHAVNAFSIVEFPAPADKPKPRNGERDHKKPWKGCGDPLGRKRNK